MKKFFVFENVMRIILFALYVIAFVFADLYVWQRDVATATGMAAIGGFLFAAIAETCIGFFVLGIGFNGKGFLAGLVGIAVGVIASLLLYLAR